jgi:hypothetical protein
MSDRQVYQLTAQVELTETAPARQVYQLLAMIEVEEAEEEVSAVSAFLPADSIKQARNRTGGPR